MSKRRRPIIRLFVSSTFTDFRHEREALHRTVFPEIERICARRQFQFQAVDLRWGISTEASLDHRTMRICLEELRRSQETSIRPSLLVLLGNRYGWRPLPEEISPEEFQRLARAAPSDTCHQILATWYVRDDNADPAAYVLRSRRRDDGDGHAGSMPWDAVQAALWQTINRAFPASLLRERFQKLPRPGDPPPAIVRFQASATEQEIWRGVLGSDCCGEDVVAVLREIENQSEFPSPVAIRDFVDVNETGLDATAQDALGGLKRVLCKRLPVTSLVEIGGARLVTRADERGAAVSLSSGDLMRVCASVRHKLAALVERQMNEYVEDTGFGVSTTQQLEFERREQQDFGETQAPVASFVGREREIEAIRSYLNDDSRQVLVIHGSSGSGKTAVLARVAQLSAEHEPVVRYVAATARSSTVESLLVGMCQELRARHRLAAPLPADLRALAREFHEHLTQGTEQRPVVVLIDALDQLAGASDADPLAWVPFDRLPRHAKLIISCLSGRPPDDPAARPYTALRRRTSPELNFLELGPLSHNEAESLLFEHLLPQGARRVTADQVAAIRANLDHESCRQPLYLKILFEEARRWSTADEIVALGRSVPELLDCAFERLSDPGNHGVVLEHAFAYLACARRGLSENELLEVLCRDEEYADSLRAASDRTGQALPNHSDRIPVAIWSRLYFDVRPYISEQSVVGGTVIGFYHRQVAEYVRGKVREPSLKHLRLAEYFADKPYFLAPEKPPGRRSPDARKVDELPWQRLAFARSSEETGVEAWESLEELFGDISFLEAKAEANLTPDLVNDFREVVRVLPSSRPSHRQFELLGEALRRDALFIARHPHALFQSMWNNCWWYDSPELKGHLDRSVGSAFARLLRAHRGPKLFLLLEDMRRIKSATSPNDTWLRAARPPAVPLGGALVATLRGPTDVVKRVEFSPNGRLLATLEPNGVRLWESESGRQISALEGRNACIAFSGDRGHFATTHEREIRIVDGEMGAETTVLRGHTGEVDAIWIAPGGRSLVSHSYQDGSLRLWNVEDAVALRVSSRHKWKLEHVRFSTDGRRVAFQDRRGSWLFDRKDQITVWDTEAGTDVCSVPGSLSTAIFSCDGKHLAFLEAYDLLSAPRRVRLVDLHSGAEQPSLACEGFDLAHITFSADGSHVVAAGSNDHLGNFFGRNHFPLLLWNVQAAPRPKFLRGHRGKITCLSLSTDGRWIATGSADRKVRLWSPNGDGCEHVLRRHAAAVSSVVFSPAATLLASSAKETVHVWSVVDGRLRMVLRGHEAPITDMVFSADESRLVTVAEDRTMRLWDCTREGTIRIRRDPPAPIDAITLSADVRTAVISAGARATLWDARRAVERRTLTVKGRWVRDVAYTKDGQLICVASRDDRFRIFDANTGISLGSLGFRTDGAAAAFSPNGRLLATSSGDEQVISLWNVQGYRCRNAIEREARRVRWRPSTRPAAVLADAERHCSLLFSPNGRLLASPFYASIAIWDLGDGNRRVLLQGHRDSVRSISFSPDGHALVSGGGALYPRECGYSRGSCDNSVRLWSVPEGVQLKVFNGHQDLVTCVAFSQDGKMIASGSRDATVCIWDATSGRELACLSGLGEPVTRVGFDASENAVFAAATQGSMRWCARTWREIEKIKSDAVETVIVRSGNDTPSMAYPEPLDLIDRRTLSQSVIFGARANQFTVLHATPFER